MNDITVIPMTNEALKSVDTQLVAFEQPFPERASRFERQMDAFRDGVSCVFLADTWPDAQHNAMDWGMKSRALNRVGRPIEVKSPVVWPETAIYKTSVARLHKIDERVIYRPHAHFFCQVRDNITGHWVAECGLASEAGIVVPDRCVYDRGLTHPPALLAEQTVRVTGILVIDHLTRVHPETIQSWQAQSEKSKELIVVHCGCDSASVQLASKVADITIDAGMVAPSDAVNAALQQAHGEYIVILDPEAVGLHERLDVQCSAALDVSAIGLSNAYAPILHTHSWMSGRPDAIEYTLMFHRRVFELTGGMYPTLPVGFIYDKFLQAQKHHELSFGVLHYQLTGNIDYPQPYGKLYSQMVYNDVFRRRLTHDRECHAWYLRRRR